MLVFSKANLVFLATPKTGTTAFSIAMRRRADIIFSKRRKHINAQRYHSHVAPWLKDCFDISPEPMAVMRNPVDQLRSWYRYRNRTHPDDSPVNTKGCSFDEFVLAVISKSPPAFARIGSQYSFFSAHGEILLTHLFAYEAPETFQSFLSERFGQEIRTKQINVSPKIDAPLSPKVKEKLCMARPKEFALYDILLESGGHICFDNTAGAEQENKNGSDPL